MEHDFLWVSLVGADYPEALPVYVKLGHGRKGHDELLKEAIGAVMAKTGGGGWIVEDRGMDSAEHLRTLKRDGRRAVVRVKDMKRDVFGDGGRPRPRRRKPLRRKVDLPLRHLSGRSALGSGGDVQIRHPRRAGVL